MRIFYFYQYFTTPEGSWSTRVHDFTREWVARGHNVTVVTAVYAKSDLRPIRFIDTQTFNGVTVKIINVRIDNKQSTLQRVFSFLVYMWIASLYALFGRYQLAIASSGPLSLMIPGIIARLIRRKNFVFEVRDLWPQGAIELGLLKKGFMANTLLFMARFAYRVADLVVTLSPGMTQYIQQRYKTHNITTVTNGIDLALIPDDLRKPVTPYAIYFGNLGEVNHSMFLVDVGAALKFLGRTDIEIWIFGDGPLKETLDQAIQQQDLHHMNRHGLVPKTQLMGKVKDALATLIPLMSLPVLNTSSPNKLFESVACGTPVVQTTKGWLEELIETHGVGKTTNNAQKAAEFLIQLADNADLRASFRDRCVRLAKTEFGTKKLALDMIQAIEQLS